MITESLELMRNIDSTTWKKARLALEKAMALYLNDSNVSHIDLGFRILMSQGNAIVPELTVRVHVHQKLYGEAFQKFAEQYPDRVIDARKIGFPVDVIEASYSLNIGSELLHSLVRHKNQHQERYDGMSFARELGPGSGILGGKVRDCDSGEEMILSCWHVVVGLQNSKPGDSIGKSNNKSGEEKQKISVDCIRDAMSSNLDAAVARVNGSIRYFNGPKDLGMVMGITTPQLGMQVQKCGASAKVTMGIITGILGYSAHRYGETIHVIGPIVHISSITNDTKLCTSGDSGAWWLEQSTCRAVGLHFAGSERGDFGLALAMPDTLRALNVEMVIEQILRPIALNHSVFETEQTEDLILKTTILSTKKLLIFSETVKKKSKFFITGIANQIYALNIPEVSKNLISSIRVKEISRSLNKTFRQLSGKLAQIFLLVIFCILTMKFNYYQSKFFHNQRQQQLDQVQKALADIKAINQIVIERNNTVKKIITIIGRYNPEMRAELKTNIANEIYEMTQRYSNLDIELICATITHETGLTWNPESVSSANAIGLMQIIPATGFHLAYEEGLEFRKIEDILVDPIISIRLGCRYLSMLISAYNIDGGLAAYNGGMRRAEIWLRNGRAKGILPEETDKYVPSILKIYEEYRKLSI